MQFRNYSPVQSLEDRFLIIRSIPGGMGIVHIGLDRDLIANVETAAQLIITAGRMDPDGITVDDPSINLSELDKIRLHLEARSGMVEAAREHRNKSLAAIKVLRPELSVGPPRDAFRYEAHLWLEIRDHPNIVQLHDIAT